MQNNSLPVDLTKKDDSNHSLSNKSLKGSVDVGEE